MAYEIRVGPAEPRPTHHVKLTVGNDTIGLILCDASGRIDPTIVRDMVPREALKMYEGEQKHSDMGGPYRTIAQEDFSGGRGSKWLEDDISRYSDGVMDTHNDRVAIMTPMYSYAQGYRDQIIYWPDAANDTYRWLGLYELNGYAYLARKFTVGSSGTFPAYNIEFFLRKRGSPTGPATAPVVTLRADNAGVPGSVLRTMSIPTDSTPTDIMSRLCRTYSSYYTLQNSTSYWVCISDTTNDDGANCWEVLCNYQTATSSDKRSTDGAAWTNTAYRLYYRIYDETDWMASQAKFFHYRGATYFGTNPDDGSAGKIYLVGDRGVADANAAPDYDKLIDASKSAEWVADRWIGAIAEIVKGVGYDEQRNWRLIEDNTTTTCTVDMSWLITHDPGGSYFPGPTEYVIKRTPWVKEILTGECFFGIQDVKLAGGNVYIGFGEHFDSDVDHVDDILSFREFVNLSDGVYTRHSKYQSGIRALFFGALKDPERGEILYWFQENPIMGLTGPGAQFSNIPEDNGDLRGTRYFGNSANWSGYWKAASGVEGPNSSPSLYNYFYVLDTFTTGPVFEFITSLDSDGDPKLFDIRFAENIWATIVSYIPFSAGELQLYLSDTAQGGNPVLTLDLPRILPNRYNQFKLPYLPSDLTDLDKAQIIKYVGLNIAVDQDADFELTITVAAMSDELGEVKLGSGSTTKITGVTEYGEPETLWVFTEDGFGEIRNNVYMPSPLSKQFAALKNRHNGKNPLAHDVYLYFPFGERGGYQRYYQNTLDSIGLDRDEGLPENRRGPIVDSCSFGSMIFHALNGGWDGWSSIWCMRGSTWHEMFRAPTPGLTIQNLFIESMPGPYPARLWFTMQNDICFIDIDLHPLQNSNILYSFENHIITGYVHSGMLDVDKLFTALKIQSANLTTTRKIYVDYRVDTDTAWTEISTPFTTSPAQEINLSAAFDVSGKWIQFRFRFENDDPGETIELFSWAVELIQMADIKFQYTLTFRLADDDVNLANEYEGATDDGAGADEKIALLQQWMAARSVGTMNTNQSLSNNITIQFVGMPLRLMDKIYETEKNRDVYIGQLTILEID